MNDALTIVIILQLTALAVAVAEIFIPSGGILSVISACLFGYSLFMAFTDVSADAGMLFVGADLVAVPVLLVVGFKILARSPATLSTTLSSDEGVTSQSSELAALKGVTGTCLTDLRPAGTAILEQRRVDVTSRGEFIEKDSRIEVFEVTGNKVFVRKIVS